ncbi:hypothetical protein Clacol_002159 [Clathrus columnatus]|uniref:Protein kinase domain-containing protein n=1 Tax=Clathrus columnatus TaxID=1419009 RepID=A0AAV4ZZY5_9AGAM|nr:hypothetical protein Clacol_002159 [Clathrus columnatus]
MRTCLPNRVAVFFQPLTRYAYLRSDMFSKRFCKPEPQEEEEDDYHTATQAEEDEAKRLWGSMRDWFFEKGYTLFELGKLGHSKPSLDTPSDIGTSPEHPFAFFGGDPPHYEPLKAYYSTKVCFAQDAKRRHVAIKKLNKPDEIRIYRFLFEKRELLAENSILPILEILDYQEHCFAVMPRWGEDTCYPDTGTIGNVLNYIHCLLKAINFLHSNSIVHRDLKSDNTLVNHFGAHRRNDENVMRPVLRSAGQLTYALFDFDLSLMLPSNECRLPASRSFEVLSVPWPYDNFQGELDYDPYKFEMGCLGIFLCQMFQVE